MVCPFVASYVNVFSFWCSIYLEVEAEGRAKGVLRLHKENRDKDAILNVIV